MKKPIDEIIALVIALLPKLIELIEDIVAFVKEIIKIFKADPVVV